MQMSHPLLLHAVFPVRRCLPRCGGQGLAGKAGPVRGAWARSHVAGSGLGNRSEQNSALLFVKLLSHVPGHWMGAAPTWWGLKRENRWCICLLARFPH